MDNLDRDEIEIIDPDNGFGVSNEELVNIVKRALDSQIDRFNDVMEEYSSRVIDEVDKQLNSVKDQFECQFQHNKIRWNARTKSWLREFGMDDLISADMIKDSILLSLGVRNYQGITPTMFERVREDRGWHGCTNNETMLRLIFEHVKMFRDNVCNEQ